MSKVVVCTSEIEPLLCITYIVEHIHTVLTYVTIPYILHSIILHIAYYNTGKLLRHAKTLHDALRCGCRSESHIS